MGSALAETASFREKPLMRPVSVFTTFAAVHFAAASLLQLLLLEAVFERVVETIFDVF